MKKVIIALLLILLAAGAFVAYKAYNYAYAPNVTAENNTYIYIPTGTDYNGLLEILKSSGNVTDMDSFEKVADFKKLDQKVLPGKYKLENGMSNNELVNMLRSGRQTPVKVTFISLRTLDILAGKAAVNIEADSADIAALLKDEETAKSALSGSSRAGSYNMVTLEVTPREAEMLVFAEQIKGRLSIALRNPTDVHYESELPRVNFEKIEEEIESLNTYRQRTLLRKRD